MSRARLARDRGSTTVELVVLTPALALLLLLLAGGARVVEVQGHIDAAARDAARAASIGRSAGEASQFAQQAADNDLGTSSWCEPHSVNAQVSGFVPTGPPPGPGAPETDVTVTVTCTVNMSPFAAIGFGPTMQFTGQAVAPLDPFVCRTGTC
ncbi:MAG TPA: TadE/TadG family type IV pilus assembly protein [Streptosporangiaceae bacterium]|nr:TadE/TadG family type IV pilus assembly protein [Streptosporangiaceae bacterium]